MERLTALTVLVLGLTVLLLTALSVAWGEWESTVGRLLLLLLVLLGMWRAVAHLRPVRAEL